MIGLKKAKKEQDRLWSDHFWLTREVVYDAVYNIPCLEVDLNKLYENQDKLGANFAVLTNCRKAGTQLAAALREHITIAVEIVQEAKLGNQEEVERLNILWQKNARKIATIYSTYNECINFCKMNKLMQEHLTTTLNEAVKIIEGKCDEAAEAGDIALEHIREMSDYINSKFPCC